MNPDSPSPRRPDLLTIALEDYFQVGAFEHVIRTRHWTLFENHLERNALATLELLERFDLRATVFVCGWIAEHFPELVRSVAAAGHEIASKGYHYRALPICRRRSFAMTSRGPRRRWSERAGTGSGATGRRTAGCHRPTSGRWTCWPGKGTLMIEHRADVVAVRPEALASLGPPASVR